MNRSKQREWVFKLIFENQTKEIEQIEESFKNHDLDLSNNSFAYESLKSFIENFDNIVEIIINQIGKLSFDRISKVDKSILMLSINEIFYMDIPVSVSINEAINLSKKYSTSEGYKFVNSVLGNIVRKNNKEN